MPVVFVHFPGTQIETDAPVDIGQALQETIPNEADFLVGFATVPGFVSYRSTTDGTWYIRKLVEILWALHTTYVQPFCHEIQLCVCNTNIDV